MTIGLGADLPASTCLGQAERLLVRRTSSSVVVLGTGEEATILRDTARAMWDAFDQTHSVAEVAAAMASRYATPVAQILSDILPFVEDLVTKGLLIVHPLEQQHQP